MAQTHKPSTYSTFHVIDPPPPTLRHDGNHLTIKIDTTSSAGMHSLSITFDSPDDAATWIEQIGVALIAYTHPELS